MVTPDTSIAMRAHVFEALICTTPAVSVMSRVFGDKLLHQMYGARMIPTSWLNDQRHITAMCPTHPIMKVEMIQRVVRDSQSQLPIRVMGIATLPRGFNVSVCFSIKPHHVSKDDVNVHLNVMMHWTDADAFVVQLVKSAVHLVTVNQVAQFRHALHLTDELNKTKSERLNNTP